MRVLQQVRHHGLNAFSSGLRLRGHLNGTAGIPDAEAYFDVGIGDIRFGFFRPFHKTHAVAGEEFFESRFEVFFGCIEPIKIKVI